VSYDPKTEPYLPQEKKAAPPQPLPAPFAAPSALDQLQHAYMEWQKRTTKEPDFLVCASHDLRTLRGELSIALRQEMPSIDEMRKVSSKGELLIGGFIVVFGPQYGAGKWS
jgi:hypothetical protein